MEGVEIDATDMGDYATVVKRGVQITKEHARQVIQSELFGQLPRLEV